MVWILKIQFYVRVRVRVRVRVQARVLLRVIKVRVCACFAVHIILDKSCSLHARPTLRTCMKGAFAGHVSNFEKKKALGGPYTNKSRIDGNREKRQI